MSRPHIIDHILLGLIGLVLVSILVLMVSAVSAGKPTASNCPAPTVEKDGKCILNSDATLTEVIKVSSGQTLDCQGHRLSPKKAGKEPTGTNPSVQSVPVAAVFLNDVTGVQIRNCAIEGFDFGLVAVNDEKAEKLSPGKRAGQRIIITGNNITALYNGINIIEADNIEIMDNQITTKGIAPPINIFLDSDSLHIHNNKIATRETSNLDYTSPYYPGSPDFYSTADGIIFNQLPAETIVFSLGGVNITFEEESSDRATNNIVEDNNLELAISQSDPQSEQSGPSKHNAGVYVSALEDGLIIRNNTMRGGSYGVSLTPVLLTQSFPDPSFWPRNVVVEDNKMLGPFWNTGVAARNTFNPIIRGNFISGAHNAGIILFGKSIETATVTRNILQDNKAGFRLRTVTSFFGPSFFGPGAQNFGASIFLNDITESSQRAIDTDFPEEKVEYTFVSEFSTEGQGNYWGRTCSDSNGFREFGEQNADSPSPYINDSNPYGFPVANEFNETKLNMPCQ
jgi:hypothetical protein